MEMTRRPPRDLTRKRETCSQPHGNKGRRQLVSLALRREVADMIRAEAAARQTTIVAIVEQSVRAYCKRAAQ